MAALVPLRQPKQCFLCKSTLTNVPKLLACFHSFCKECLREIMKDLKVGDTMPCPECEMPITVPNGGGDGIADDFLQSTKQKLATLHEGNIKLCNVCEFIEEEILAFYYCIDCKYHLCERDKKRHKATPSQRDHNVISYEEMNSGKYDPEIVESTLGSCPYHSSVSETRLLTFYCKECETLVCNECILATHKGHKLTSLQDVSNDYQNKVTEMLHEVCKTREKKMETMKSVKQDMHDLNDNKDKLITEVEERGKYLISSINGMAQNMIDDVQCKYSVEEEKCETAIKTLKDMSLCAENVKMFIEQCMEYSSDVFVISHYKDIIRNAELCLKNLQKTPQVQSKTYAFAAHDDVLAKETLQLWFGEIRDMSLEVQNRDVPTEPHATVDTKQTENALPPPVPLTTTMISQTRIPGILDVTILEKGDIIILTSSAVCRLVNESSPKTIYSNQNAKMCDIQSWKNDIYISVKHDPRGVIICNVDGNVKLIVKVPEQKLNLNLCGVAVDNRNGTLYFGGEKGKVYKFEFPYDKGEDIFAQRLNTPSSLCCDNDGNGIISDGASHQIMKYDCSGNKKWHYGSKGNGHRHLGSPRGVCTDEKGNIYVADYNNHHVHLLSPDGLWLGYVIIYDRKYERMLSSPSGLHYSNRKLYVTSQNPSLLTVFSIG